MVTAKEIEACLLAEGNEAQRLNLMRFFKTAPGQYGDGDEFIGLKVPQTRLVVKEAAGRVALPEIEKLLHSRWHECRLAGFLLIVDEMKRALPKKSDRDDSKLRRRRELARFYLRHARQANNWDLVDMSCPKILGYYLIHNPEEDYSLLTQLAKSTNLWEQRIAMVTNWMLIRHGIYGPTFAVADLLLSHPHDLIHKAVGWMLREVGKRNMELLEEYLEANYAKMPRTALRYAIEKMPEPRRLLWLHRH